jgi:hypothetical protein
MKDGGIIDGKSPNLNRTLMKIHKSGSTDRDDA